MRQASSRMPVEAIATHLGQCEASEIVALEWLFSFPSFTSRLAEPGSNMTDSSIHAVATRCIKVARYMKNQVEFTKLQGLVWRNKGPYTVIQGKRPSSRANSDSGTPIRPVPQNET